MFELHISLFVSSWCTTFRLLCSWLPEAWSRTCTCACTCACTSLICLNPPHHQRGGSDSCWRPASDQFEPGDIKRLSVQKRGGEKLHPHLHLSEVERSSTLASTCQSSEVERSSTLASTCQSSEVERSSTLASTCQRWREAPPSPPPVRVQRWREAPPSPPPVRVQRWREAPPSPPPVRVQRWREAPPSPPPVSPVQTGVCVVSSGRIQTFQGSFN
ncbi:CCAAT/enhancer-binding protein gamma isoform X1 [Leuresthes tenuis]|uniref:CCAAT/enhancer-binding protein gamma isoform X1 n=1 Tax=Leuresthes tenuis TaxID=355514 RepID=UPI003B5140F2